MTNLIIGYGTTGKSIQKYLQKINESYLIYDDNNEVPDVERFSDTKLENVNTVFVSPGINPNHWILKEAKKLKIKIKTDIEMFSDLNTPKLIGVTGTNGKTSFVNYLSEILNKNGYKSITGGNIGVSPLDYVDDINQYDFIILELSSFQLEYINSIHLEMAIVTNIFEDHIDWHNSFKSYTLTKLKIFNFVKEYSNNYLGETDHRVVIDKNIQFNKVLNKKYNLDNYFDEFVNLMVTVCKKFEIEENEVINFLLNQPTMEHRFEKFFKTDNTIFINDSKSTNFQSVYKATTKVNNALLILHGLTKGMNPKTLKVSESVKEVLLPTYMDKSLNFKNIKVTNYTYFEELKNLIHEKSKNYEYVLFSCGGSSFNEFKNYKERGEKFKEIVMDAMK